MVNERSFAINADASGVRSAGWRSSEVRRMVTQAGFDSATPSFRGSEYLSNSRYL